MSHTATIQIDFSNRQLLKQVCKELGLQYREGLHQIRLYEGEVAADFSIQLPGWRYPIAICGNEVRYDNFNGNWGQVEGLQRLQDQYSKLLTIQHAEQQGWTWEEVTDPETGGIQLNLYDYTE
jgi:hypothetical protein